MEQNETQARDPGLPEPDGNGTGATASSTDDSPPHGKRRGASGVRKIVATALLAVGLLTLGGAAVVNAASPAPSASSAASGATSGGTATNGGHSCP